MDRRRFLGNLGAASGAALAFNLGLFHWSARQVLGRPMSPNRPDSKPLIHVGFCHAEPGAYKKMGWPGVEYDEDASRNLYIKTLREAAKEQCVALDVEENWLGNDKKADAFLETAMKKEADGIILINMDAHVYGMRCMYRILEKRGDNTLPVLGFVPHGTLHADPSDYKPFQERKHCFLASSANIDWLADGLRLLNAQWQMANTRLALVTGNQEREEKVEPLGTVLRYTPMQHYQELQKATEGSEEAQEIARLYRENAKGVLEPSEEEILEAARATVATRQLIEETEAHGALINCFGPVTSQRILPPCLGFMQLLDEGSVGVCEGDVFPGLTQLLSSYLVRKPGFLHNPIHDTTRNIYGGGHCTAPTRMAGFDETPEEYILRSHHEAGFGAVPQVLLKENQPATLWRFLSPNTLMIATGTILRNVDTQRDNGVGGCRTSFVMAMDDVEDVRQIRAHHKILTYGRHLNTVRAWTRLAGVELEHVTGGPA